MSLETLFRQLERISTCEGDEELLKQQFRALITAYCLINDITAYDFEWDELINDIYYNHNSFSTLSEYGEFDNYMCAFLL